MPKLSEVLGGVLKDLTHSRIVADAVSRECFDAYQADPVLARVPVPRLTIKEVSLKLRFAVEEHAHRPGAESDELVFARLWRQELATRVLPHVLRVAPKRPLDPAVIAAATAKAARSAAVSYQLGVAAAGRQGPAIQRSVTDILKAMQALPAAARRQLPALRALRRIVERQVRDRLEAMLPRLQQLSIARLGGRLDLDVAVRRADLAAVHESAIQEVTLTIAMDDLQAAEPGVPHPAGS